MFGFIKIPLYLYIALKTHHMTTQTEISFYEKNLEGVINPCIELCSPNQFGVYPFGKEMFNNWMQRYTDTQNKLSALRYQLNPARDSSYLPAKQYPKTYRNVA